jgi:hypothetical protein
MKLKMTLGNMTRNMTTATLVSKKSRAVNSLSECLGGDVKW